MISGTEVREVEKTVGAVDVLVAAKDINLGDSVGGGDVKWQQWPLEGVTPGLITKTAEPDAPQNLSGAIARATFIAGEPIKEQKLIKVSEGGVMAAILPAGMRAISTPIREETAAGGFILPNDHVDVILSRTVKVGNKDDKVSETILRNIPCARHRSDAGAAGGRQSCDRQDGHTRAYTAADRNSGARSVARRDLTVLA